MGCVFATQGGAETVSKLDDVLSKANKRRVDNLRDVLKRYKSQGVSQKEVAEKKLRCTSSYVSQMVGQHPTRALSERTAREIEKKLGLEEEWLDKDHPAQTVAPSVTLNGGDGSDAKRITRLIAAFAASDPECQEALLLTAARFAGARS